MDTSLSTSPPPLPSRRPRRWLVRAGVMAVSMMVAFAAVELAVRWKVGTPMSERLPILRVQANPYRGWEMVPGEDHYTYQHPVAVNALGLRGDEIPEEVGDERRVLCLGDSLVYGQGVGDEETLPAHLEKQLDQLSGGEESWRAINGGLRAYSTNQEIGLLEEFGERLKPEEVVLFWFWNDYRERPVQATHDNLAAWGPVAFDTSASMEGWPLWRWRGLQLLRRSAAVMFAWDQVKYRGASFPSAEVLQTGLDRLREHLLRMQELCGELGCRPWVALVPDSGAILGEHPSESFRTGAGEVAREVGIGVIDLLPALRELERARGRLPVLPFDGHYTSEANAVMARAVARALRE